MSLDVYLNSDSAKVEPLRWAIFIREDGQQKEISLDEWNARFAEKGPPVLCQVGGESRELYHRNITHNLGKMANAAGIYDCMWRPDEHTLYDVANEVAHRVYALTRGSVREAKLPEHLIMAWEDLDEARRALYVDVAKAGIEHDRRR